MSQPQQVRQLFCRPAATERTLVDKPSVPPVAEKSPSGMSRRHFLRHVLGAGSLALPAIYFADRIQLHAQELRRQQKAVILLWMGGGPSTLDSWDPKPGAETGGPFQAIATSVPGVQICEHLPMMSRQMHRVSIIRSMSTREADHDRGRYYMHTGYRPSPTISYPSIGSIVSYELGTKVPELAIPSFVAVGGPSEGSGFLGMTHAPFVVSPNGDIPNLRPPDSMTNPRIQQRLAMLTVIEQQFIRKSGAQAAVDHREVYEKTLSLMTSQQMRAFQVDQEPAPVRERYGNHSFGRGCLMARRLVEAGVSFVEVDLGGWDNHSDIFPTLSSDKLPVLDQAMSALVEDLHQRGLWERTAIVWMGEFGRTPRINANSGRDHWPRSWSVVVGGCGLKSGLAVGATDRQGIEVVGESYDAADLFATLCHVLGIPLETVYTSANGRPVKITDNGQVIRELV